MKPMIVVAAYNRPDSLKRLLLSIQNAHYETDDIVLTISLDRSESRSCAEIADGFDWPFGEKRVIEHKERQGLKKHLLFCGGQALSPQGAAIILEDDLYVAEDFYGYACSALEFSGRNPAIGGISLYNHSFNVFARLPFLPVEDGFDNWYLQLASSWGQAVTAEQWQGFRDWLDQHDGEELQCQGMPDEISAWGESSWLKYHIRYLVDTGKYFLYPRVSYTTNFTEEGEHAKRSVTELQLPLAGKIRREPVFSEPEESDAVYDAFFENTKLGNICDLYGIKYREGKLERHQMFYSLESLPFRSEASYALSMRPPEENIKKKIPGNDIRLYDLSSPDKKSGGEKKHIDYYYKGINRKKIVSYVRDSWNLS